MVTPAGLPQGHPHAWAAAEATGQLAVLADWTAGLEGQDLVLDLQLREDGTYLRVRLGQQEVRLDAAVGQVLPQPHLLAWLLAENVAQEFKACAVPGEAGQLTVFVTASYPLSTLPDLGRLIWAGFEAALAWRGRLWQAEARHVAPTS